MGSLGPFDSTIFTLLFLLHLFLKGEVVGAATFTFKNRCAGTVWPGALSNSGSPVLETTGFELTSGGSRAVQAPTGWSGRFWARTGCAFDGSGRGSCATGDCGSGGVECGGAGAAPPATLAEFTLAGAGRPGQDFYDVSLVDGYNVPVAVEARGGTGTCAPTGCAADLNRRCPAELRVGEGEGRACRSACGAFGSPQYCCSGAFASPSACRPSSYSEVFKSACPLSYSYAFDDATSTFTCSGADYLVTFCPASPPPPSEKSTRDPPPTEEWSTEGGGESSLSSQAGGGVTENDDSWLASLATGDTAATVAEERVSLFSKFVCTLVVAFFTLL